MQRTVAAAAAAAVAAAAPTLAGPTAGEDQTEAAAVAAVLAGRGLLPLQQLLLVVVRVVAVMDHLRLAHPEIAAGLAGTREAMCY